MKLKLSAKFVYYWCFISALYAIGYIAWSVYKNDTAEAFLGMFCGWSLMELAHRSEGKGFMSDFWLYSIMGMAACFGLLVGFGVF